MLLSLSSVSALANRSVNFTLQLSNAKLIKLKVHDYTNARGQRELRYETDDLAKVTLGHARDVDGDGEVETFFIFGDAGIARYHRSSPGEDSYLRSRRILTQHASHSGRTYLSGLSDNILSFFFFGMEHLLTAQRDFYLDWMDLEELQLTLEKHKGQLTRDEYIYGLQVVIDGNRLALERLERALGSEQAAMWSADAGLWLSGAVLIKWAAKALKGLRAKNELTHLGAHAGARLTLKSYQTTIHSALRAIALKSKLQLMKRALVKSAKNIKAEWKYIATSTVAQSAAETYVSYQEVKAETPATMALNLLRHPEVQENMSVGLTQTMLMTGASTLTNSRLGKFALLGTVGATSSFAAGQALNGRQSQERILFDTAWTVGVDSAQLMVELNVLHRFSQAAVARKNPRLKVVGYGIVLLTQVGSYYGYARASRWVDPKELESSELRLIPLVAQH